MKRNRSGLFIITVFAVIGIGFATQRLVPSIDYPTIQDAINAANDGDTISVWGPPPGGPPEPPYTYYQNVDYLGKRLVVASRCFLPGWQGCEPTWDSVVIDGRQRGPVVVMTGSTNSVLKGFTIQNGWFTGYGGGVCCHGGYIVNNHIHNNHSELGGAGIFYWYGGGPAQIYDNLIENNISYGPGGGILVEARSVDLRRNIIRNNTARNYGAAFVYIILWILNHFPVRA